MRVQADRVVTEVSGVHVAQADPPLRIVDTEHLPEWVFVREDLWALGACSAFAFQAFEAWRRDWRVVYQVDALGNVLRQLTPSEFEVALLHYVQHAFLVRRPAASKLGDQVIARAPCGRCGWSPETDPANVPDALVLTAACQCRFCKRADRYHQQEAEVAREERAAAGRSDHDEAGRVSDLRRRLLDRAAEALAQCEGRATT